MTTFASILLRWYKKAGRDLPWRKTADPYAIWVSEILLQQTQVATALPYYRRFLVAFPTVQDLAAAPIDAVLKLWQGLGYYARARHLSEAAKRIVDRFGGEVPATQKELLSLPGIGRSTAGAILNIAFHQRHPVLDGNVKRVLIRTFCIRENKEKNLHEKLWRLADQMLPRRRVDHFTQAIMDLGATICLPKNPKCAVCPVSRVCQAYQKGWQDRLPLKPVQKKVPHYDYVAAVIRRGESVLIRRRPSMGLLGGLWEFPGGRVTREGHFSEIMQKEVGQAVAESSPWFKIKHQFSHFKMTLHLFHGTVRKKGIRSDHKWVPVNRLEEYPFSSAHQKVVLKLMK